MNTAPPKPPRAPGFWWALAGFGLGSAVSVGFNLQSAWLHNHTPSIASQAAAIVWPLTLIVSVEVLSRVTWPHGWGWKVVRFSGILAVALGSATISYGHIYDVLTAWGYEKHQAIVGPLVVDGLMLISGFALVALGRASRAVLDTSREVVSAVLSTTSHTPDVPHRTTSPTRGEELAVSVTPPTPSVTETASQEASPLPLGEASPEPPGLRLVPSQRLLPDPKTTSRKASQKPSRKTSQEASCSEEDVFAEIASYLSREGRLPTANWLKTNLSGLGHKRAGELLSEYSSRKQEVTA